MIVLPLKEEKKIAHAKSYLTKKILRSSVFKIETILFSILL